MLSGLALVRQASFIECLFLIYLLLSMMARSRPK